MGGESEIRLGLVFKPFDLDKRKKLMDRIRQIMALNKNSLHEVTTRARGVKNLIFNNDHEDDDLLNSLSPKALQRDTYGDEDDQDGMAESSVFLHGANTSSRVKIVDKSKRAFEMSNESTQALELSLQKPRDSCAYKM